MTKKTRLFAICLVSAICLVMLSSVCFLTACADHDCVGEECSICERIAACGTALKAFALMGIAAVTAAAVHNFAVTLSAAAGKRRGGTTLVSLKVKLSN